MLADTLKQVISNSYALYFKAHSFHWNLEGPNFLQYHEFLKNYYTDVYDSIDTFAELIRTLDQYAPTSLQQLVTSSDVEEETSIPDDITMLKKIKDDNNLFLAILVKAYDEAGKASEIGVQNFIQNRIQAHEKHAWMLRVITK